MLISLRLRGRIDEDVVVSLLPAPMSASEDEGGGKMRELLVMPAVARVEDEGSMLWLVCGPSARETCDHES